MGDIRILYNIKANPKKQIAHVIRYPDGVERTLSMRPDEWGKAFLAKRYNYPFYGVLGEAVELAYGFPTEKGFDKDVLHQTREMFCVIWQLIEREKHQVADENL